MTRRSITCTAVFCIASLAYGGSAPRPATAGADDAPETGVRFVRAAPVEVSRPEARPCECDVSHEELFEQIRTTPDTVALAMPRQEYFELP